jgi:hypothetical protein
MPVLVPVNHGNGGSDEPSRSLEPETAARNGSSPAATSSTSCTNRYPGAVLTHPQSLISARVSGQ